MSLSDVMGYAPWDNNKAILGWYCYAVGFEVFVTVSLTLFLPICLEQFARDNGFLLPEKTMPCSAVTATGGEAARCVVKLGWAWIDTASFSLYVYSASVLLQALTVISIGGIAKTPSGRKSILLRFGLLGSTAASLFLLLPSTSAVWFLVAFLAIFANVGLGASVVAYNSYLSLLSGQKEEVVLARKELEDARRNTNANAADDSLDNATEDVRSSLLPSGHSAEIDDLKANYDSLLSRTMSRLSSFAIALGYGGGIVMLILTLIPVNVLHGTTFALRIAIGLSGLWWALLIIPPKLWLPNARKGAIDTELKGSLKGSIFESWKNLERMLRWSEIMMLKNTFWYLSSWFLLSDGFSTITSTAILFGKTSLGMQPSELILIGILSPCAGIIGSLLWPMLQRRFSLSNHQVIIRLVLLASVVPFYGCLGFLPIFKELRFGGLTTKGEMYGLALYFGAIYGAFQGYARAFYAELVPPGEEARWFALYSITDKSSSFIGPLMVGIISDVTGNIRYALFFLVALVWMGVPLLAKVNVDKGREDARIYSSRLRRDGDV